MTRFLQLEPYGGHSAPVRFEFPKFAQTSQKTERLALNRLFFVQAGEVVFRHGCGKLGVLGRSDGERPFVADAAPRTSNEVESSECIQFPVLRYTSEKLELLSESARREALHNLHLDSRAATSMTGLGIHTIGGFVDKLKQGINAPASRMKKSCRGGKSNVRSLSFFLSHGRTYSPSFSPH